MPVTSTTLAGVNVWRFSGAVTDAEVKTAWASLIVNQRYKPGRAIYIDDTCSLVNVRGTYHVDCEALGVILHSSRNKANTVFNNWILNQTAGLSVGARANFVRTTNGTTITATLIDGIDMKGGGMIYAPVGNPGGGDPRFLNEMQFGSLDGTIVTSQAYTEQELEPASIGTIWRGLNIQKCAGFPILGGTNQRQVVYRSAINTEGIQKIVRPYNSNSVCYVTSTVRRNGVAVTTNLYDTFAGGSTVIMVLNNYTDESWFGAAKTTISGSNWSAGNRFIGGVMKKIQVQPSTVIRTYDSRSTAVSQKSTFSETTNDFLTGTGTTNLALYSEQLDNGYWTKGNTTIAANDINSPIGTLTADKVREDTANAQHRINTSSMAAVAGQPYTYSFYAKAAERSFVHARMISTGITTNAEACFNLTAGTFIASAGTTATITSEGGGWFRCSITGSPTTTSVIAYANMALSSSLTVPVYTGTANSGMHMWGHQFERSSVPTNYIATVAAIADGNYTTVSDATTGRAQFVSVGAIATGGGCSITRYTGQKFTLQKFGYRVQVETPDMGFGDDDLSAYSPITMTEQAGIARDQATIAAATTITSFQDLLEELHVLALAQVGAASYNAYGSGNLFTFEGGNLTTNFTTVNIDATAAAKITYNSTTNTLTVKSLTMTSNETVTEWSNAGGAVNLLNGAAIQGLYTSSAGPNSILQLKGVTPAAVAAVWHPTTTATELYQVNNTGSAADYTLYYPPGSVGLVKRYARELYGTQRSAGTITLAAGLNVVEFIDIPDVGITEESQATVAAYTAIEGPSKFYDRTAVFRLTEQGIKLGQMVTRAGTALEIGTFNHLINQNAAAVYSVLGSTITTKSTSYAADAKYTTEIATPPATITAATTEVITIAREDANGNSQVTIQAAGVSTFEIWKITDATSPDDYATGTLLDTVGIGTYRFIGVNGFKMVIRDTTTNFRVVTEMEKGIYTAELFFGAQVQLAQAAEVSIINTKVDLLQNDLNAAKGAGFDTATDSLKALRVAVDTKPTAAETAAAVLGAPVETGATLVESLRLHNAVLGGKVSGAGSGVETFRDLADTKDRLVSTVDESGNRLSETSDLT
jgi:hypothetical protein